MGTRHNRTILIALTIGFALFGLSVTSQSYGAANAIRLCVDKKTQVVTQKPKCSSSERTLILNGNGIPGPIGPAGPRGETGLQGPKGETGPAINFPRLSSIHVFDAGGNDLGKWIGTTAVFGAHCFFTSDGMSIQCVDDTGARNATPIYDSSFYVAYFSGPACTGELMSPRLSALPANKFATSPSMTNLHWQSDVRPQEIDMSLAGARPQSVMWDADRYVAEAGATSVIGATRPSCVTYQSGQVMPRPVSGLNLVDPFDYSNMQMPRMDGATTWDSYRYIDALPAPVAVPIAYAAVN